MTRPSEDPGRRVLRAKVHDLFRHLPRALTGDEESIHQMRVSGRRLRVALPLLAVRPAGRRARRALAGIKDLTRAAGASRDLDVMLEGLEQELPPVGKRTRPQSQLLARLRNTRRRARTRMTDSVLDLEIGRLRRDLRTILLRGCDPLLVLLQRIRESETAQAAELVGILTVLGGDFEPVALHRMRIRLRRLRYAAELSAEIAGRPLPAEDLFKNMQDELGRIRDLYLLSQWLGTQALRPDPAVAAEAARLESRFLERSRAEHRLLLASDPRARLGEMMRRLGHRLPAA
jgi:triphosphatase